MLRLLTFTVADPISPPHNGQVLRRSYNIHYLVTKQSQGGLLLSDLHWPVECFLIQAFLTNSLLFTPYLSQTSELNIEGAVLATISAEINCLNRVIDSLYATSITNCTHTQASQPVSKLAKHKDNVTPSWNEIQANNGFATTGFRNRW